MLDGLWLVMDRVWPTRASGSALELQSKCQTTGAGDSSRLAVSGNDRGLWDLLPTFPHYVLPAAQQTSENNHPEPAGVDMKTRDKAPGRSPGWEELAFVQRAETAERDCLRAARWPLHPLSLTVYFADSLHPGAAVDTDRRQAEAVSGEPAANHAENTTMIRGARIKSSVDLGGDRLGICTRELG